MIQKKICLLGGHAVGKTSLVAQFVRKKYADTYHTTIGVKVDKKVITAGATEVSLMIWDLAGEDDFGPAEVSYLRGASGYLLVLDGTRRASLERALAVQQRAEEKNGALPFIVLVNKVDLAAEWELGDEDFSELAARGWTLHRTSAKTGEFVEAAFQALAEEMLRRP